MYEHEYEKLCKAIHQIKTILHYMNAVDETFYEEAMRSKVEKVKDILIDLKDDVMIPATNWKGDVVTHISMIEPGQPIKDMAPVWKKAAKKWYAESKDLRERLSTATKMIKWSHTTEKEKDEEIEELEREMEEAKKYKGWYEELRGEVERLIRERAECQCKWSKLEANIDQAISDIRNYTKLIRELAEGQDGVDIKDQSQ